MAYVVGTFLVVIGFSMMYFARPKNGKDSWAFRFPFFGELYTLAAISVIALGVCFATLS